MEGSNGVGVPNIEKHPCSIPAYIPKTEKLEVRSLFPRLHLQPIVRFSMTFYVQFQGMSGMSGSRNLRRLQLVLFQHGFLWQEALDLLAQRARLLRHVTL